jgi:hypothetical protein
MVVMHSCDNPPCCNPAHLSAGTVRDNALDMIAKGRANPPRGELHPSHLRPELVARGDAHWSRRRPEAVLRGDSHWTARRPDRVARGDRHSSRTSPDTIARGEMLPNSKLTGPDVVEIRAMRATGAKLWVIAAKFGVSESLVGMVCQRRIWKHVA